MNRDITAQFIKMLTNLDHCLAKAEAHAAAKQFNVENFFGERLIVDMLPLSKQVLDLLRFGPRRGRHCQPQRTAGAGG